MKSLLYIRGWWLVAGKKIKNSKEPIRLKKNTYFKNR